MKTGVTKTNPALELKQLKKPERLPQFLQESEAMQVLAHAEAPADLPAFTNRLILELLYQCGLRRQELIELSDRDIEGGSLQLRVMGKGSKERLIPIQPALLELIQAYRHLRDAEVERQDHQRLLVLPTGKPLYPMYVYRLVHDEIQNVATLNKKSPHILRHSFATHLLENGANIQAIKELLGHSSLAATQVYTHTTIDRLRDVHKKNHPRG